MLSGAEQECRRIDGMKNRGREREIERASGWGNCDDEKDLFGCFK